MITNVASLEKQGKEIANEMYQELLDHPEYLGLNWNWVRFPHYVAVQAKYTAYGYLDGKNGDFKEQKCIMVRAAKEEAIKLVKSERHLKHESS